MVEAVMLWNEPNNLSHWDFELDPEWRLFADMVKQASAAIKAENPRLTRVLGGISPIDPAFVKRMDDLGVLAVCRCNRSSWIPARLESLEHPRMAR